MDLVTRPLDANPWPDVARLVEDHHGVRAGCWCLNFHAEGRPHVHTPQQRQELKELRVREGRLGGGVVESYPEDSAGRRVPGSFLYNATVALFEHHGFERVRRIGKHHWVVSRFVG